MPLQLAWQLSTGPSAAPAGQWLQLAEAVEYAGLAALLLPAGEHLPEPLTLAAALSTRTRHLQLIAGARLDSWLPAALATTAQSLQALSGNRLQLYLQGSGLAAELPREREFEELFERLLLHRGTAALQHQGEHFRLEHAERLLRDLPAPPLWLPASRDSQQIARHARHCLFDAAPPAQMVEQVRRVRALGRQRQRRIACHARLGLLARASAEEAWDAAAQLLPEAPAGAYGVRRLHGHPARRQEIHPNLWQPEADAPPWLVGSYAQVATRIAELQDAGLDGLVLSAPAPVAECLRLGEEILPRLRRHESGTR